MTMNIEGDCPPQWDGVRQAFADNFRLRGDDGAAFCVYWRGEPLLSLWAGQADDDTPWREDTLVNVFSVGKGLLALAMQQLVSRGSLELAAPVARYWPEFAAAGKADITVAMLLDHTAGLPALHDPVPDEAIYRWPAMVERLAAEQPWWPPGTAQGYHVFTYGWLVGEVLRRISGKTPGDYLQEMAGDVASELYWGVPDAALPRCARLDRLPRRRESQNGQASDQSELVNKAFSNPASLMGGTNGRAWRQAQIPAANLHASARALAAIYGDLAGPNPHLLDKSGVQRCSQGGSARQDRVFAVPLRFGPGFMLGDVGSGCVLGQGAHCFGHPGAGGSLAFADPDYGLGIAYVTRRLSGAALVDRRARALIDAVYRVF